MDLDRDSNVPVPGSATAGSAYRGNGTSPRFSSAGRGLKLLSELFDELHVPATFFAEAETLSELRDSAGFLSGFETGVHGYGHEDFTLLDLGDAESVVTRAGETVRDTVGIRPVSFRAPYLKMPDYLPDVLRNHGFTVDSSVYAEGEACRPHDVRGITELPVCRDSGGRTSYLWPMHEGKRAPESYLGLAETVGNEGVFVLCDHCWHIVEHCDGSPKSDTEVTESVRRIRRIVCALLDGGYTPCTVSQCVCRP